MNLSIIVPTYNSSEFLELLVKEIQRLKEQHSWEHLEVLFIDDGSLDDSHRVAARLKQSYNFVKAYKLSRNFGHQNAVSAGLRLCTGEYVAIIDDDMQDPPELIVEMLKIAQSGYDVVYGVRKKRKEGFIKVFCYKAFYRILSNLSDIKIPLDSGDFCVMRKKVVAKMILLEERNPFLRGVRSWVGFKQTGFEYERHARVAGESGYSLRKLLAIAFDGIFSFSYLPLRIMALAGATMMTISLSYLAFVLIKWAMIGIRVEGFVATILLITLFGSFHTFCLGILGEYVARIYTESKKRPLYIISESTEAPL